MVTTEFNSTQSQLATRALVESPGWRPYHSPWRRPEDPVPHPCRPRTPPQHEPERKTSSNDVLGNPHERARLEKSSSGCPPSATRSGQRVTGNADRGGRILARDGETEGVRGEISARPPPARERSTPPLGCRVTLMKPHAKAKLQFLWGESINLNPLLVIHLGRLRVIVCEHTVRLPARFGLFPPT